MKKTALFLLTTLIAAFFLTACRAEYTDSYEPVCRFLKSYGVHARVFRSLADEDEEGYIDNEFSKQLFTKTELLPRDFTVAMSSRLEYVFEIGAFITPSQSDGLALADMCRERIELLESLADGKGELVMSGNLLIYIFDKNPKDAVVALKRVL